MSSMTVKPQFVRTAACCVLGLVLCASASAQSTTAAKPSAATPSEGHASPAPAEQPTVKTDAAAPTRGTAVVDFHNGLLHVVATDADLNTVLQQVSRLTGMRLQGFTNGDRLYGDYGPAPSVDVLSRMLDGLPYNFVMTQAPHTPAPQQLVISFRNGPAAGSSSTSAAPANSAASAQQPAPDPSYSTNPEEGQPDQEIQGEPMPDEQPQPEATPPPAADGSDPDKPNGTPGGAKTPEQFLEELRKLHQNGRPQ